MRKIFLLFIIAAGFGATLQAQHAPQFSNFMFNKLVYNPAYAGSHDVLTMSALYRNQWAGIVGAPVTANFNMHMPFWNDRCGAGLSVVNDRIGMINSTYVNLSYNYRIPVGEKSKLSMGLMGRLEQGSIDWTQVDELDAGDQMIGMGQMNEIQPNFGAGVYLSNNSYYVGFSVPQILRNNLYNDLSVAESVQNFYLMGGVVLPINKNVKVKPAVLLTYNPSAPFEAEFNANFIFMDALWLGASYRLGDSFDGIIAYQFTKQLRGGVAVDFTTSELNSYTSGSYEIMLQYSFQYDKSGVTNLRYF